LRWAYIPTIKRKILAVTNNAANKLLFSITYLLRIFYQDLRTTPGTPPSLAASRQRWRRSPIPILRQFYVC
jgi:hypothetical protein